MEDEADPGKMGRLAEVVASPDDASVEYAVSMLDDADIRIRGEAFCTLILIERDVAAVLERHLSSPSRYVRAFCALILANRGDSASAPRIVPLLDDDRALVRSCALGALGYLRYAPAADLAKNLLDDENEEVRISARQVVSDMGAPA